MAPSKLENVSATVPLQHRTGSPRTGTAVHICIECMAALADSTGCFAVLWCVCFLHLVTGRDSSRVAFWFVICPVPDMKITALEGALLHGAVTTRASHPPRPTSHNPLRGPSKQDPTRRGAGARGRLCTPPRQKTTASACLSPSLVS